MYITKKDKLTGKKYNISLVDPRIIFKKEKILELSYPEQEKIIESEKEKFNKSDNFLETHDNQIFEAYETEYLKIIRAIRL